MGQRKTKDLRKLGHHELLTLARRVSSTPISREESVDDLLEAVGRSLSLEEIKWEVHRITARRRWRKRLGRRFNYIRSHISGKRWGERLGSRRSLIGLMVLVIVVSSSCIALLGSVPPQYYLVQAWEKQLGTGEFEGYVYQPLGAVDADGNLIVATTLPDSSLAKFGPTGVEEWRRSFIVRQGSSVVVSCISVEAESRHVFIGGIYINSTGWHHGFLACFDSFGEVAWVLDWGRLKFARSVCAANGSVYVAGIDFESSPSRAFIAKYDSEGNLLWNATSGADGPYDAYAICADNHGNVFVAGISDESILIKYDSTGTELWNSTWDYQFGVFSKLVRTEDGYVYVLDTAGWLNKHSIDNGTLIWRKQLGWFGTHQDFSVDTFSINENGGIDAGGVYRKIDARDSKLTFSHIIWVASYDSDGERMTNVTSPDRDGELYAGTVILRHDWKVYVVGGIYYRQTSTWEFVLEELGVVSSFLAGTTLVVGLGSAAFTILAVLWKEKRISMRRLSM